MDGTENHISRRAAAQKAQKLAADQLNNSSSDDSTAASGRRQNKGAKSRRVPKGTKPVKSMSNLSSMRLDTNLENMSTQSSQHRRRQSLSSQAKLAGPSRRDNAVPVVSDESGSDIEIVGMRRPGEPHTSFSSNVDPPSTTTSSTSVSGPLLKTPLVKKRVLSTAELSPVTSAGSLTPLTSPEAIRSRSHSGFAPGLIDEPSSPAVEEWSLDTLGRLVWVRIDISGNISKSRVDSIWWPAKVVRDSPLRLALFGKYPTAPPDGVLELDVEEPSYVNVRTLAKHGQTLRFNERTYGGMSIGLRTSLFSPRKRQKTSDHDLHARWQEALKLMLKADTHDNDGFPRFISIVDNGSDFHEMSDDDLFILDQAPRIEEDSWVPPPPNFEYDIPGELVLAKDRVNATQHWPAKILDYVPPKHRKQKARYKVLFFDHSMKDITEDMFFTESQEGFGTCKLGESEGNYGLDDEERDADDVFESDLIDEDEDSLRASTPLPEMPPPKHFETLDIEEQFEYVKPILIAILQNKYGPVRQRHNAFMASAAARQRVVDENQLSGNLRGYELEKLGPLIRRWIRRRQMRQKQGLLPSDDLLDDGSEDVEMPRHPLPPPSTIESEPDHTSTIDVSSDDGAATEPLSEGSLPPSSSLPDMGVENHSSQSRESLERDEPDPELRREPCEPATGLSDGTFSAKMLSEPSGTAFCAEGPGYPPEGPGYRNSVKSFTSLAEIDQITYCMSVLLQEAKYQLLLWRHGLRDSLDLASSSEEEQLHGLAEKKAADADWVHTIIQTRRLVERTMLPTSQSGSQSKPLSRLRSGRD